MYRHECPLCEEVIESSTSVKERAKEHVKRHHRTEVEKEFKKGYTGSGCQSGCGYKFPRDSEKHPGLICSDCGRDHFKWYAGILGYLSVEKFDET